jgi:hypothetical protein
MISPAQPRCLVESLLEECLLVGLLLLELGLLSDILLGGLELLINHDIRGGIGLDGAAATTPAYNTRALIS